MADGEGVGGRGCGEQSAWDEMTPLGLRRGASNELQKEEEILGMREKP